MPPKETLYPMLIGGAVIIALLIGLISFVIFVKYFNTWLRAFVTRARVSMGSLVAMSLRKVNTQIIVDSKIMAVQAGLEPISTQALEAHYLTGGNVKRVI